MLFFIVATLFDDLDNLRNGICHACKKKFVSDYASGGPRSSRFSQDRPSSAVQPSGSTHASSDASLHVTYSSYGASFQPTTPAIPPPIAPTYHLSAPFQTATDVAQSVEPSDPPRWSVVYNPDATQALKMRISHVFKYRTPVYCMKISPDGQTVAIGLAGVGKTYITEVKTGLNVQVLWDYYCNNIEDPLSIWSLQFSPDGRLLATGASDNRIRIWDIAQKRIRTIFIGHTQMGNTLKFSPCGRFLVSGSYDLSVKVWNMRDGSYRDLVDDSNDFLSVAFSADGRYIAAGTLHQWLSIWNARTGKRMGNWIGHRSDVWCVEFTPDGKGLMSGSRDRRLKYWDMTSLQDKPEREPGQGFPVIRSFTGHTDRVRSIAFSPVNGRWVLTSSDDQSVRLWDTQTGVWQLTLLGHTNWVRQVDFSRTENLLATASKDCCVVLWRYEVM